VSIINEIPVVDFINRRYSLSILKNIEQDKGIFPLYGFNLVRLGSWKGRSLPSRRSIVMFDRTYDHIGNEISQVA